MELTCERELIGISLSVFKGDINEALDLLLEMVTEVKIDEKSLEGEKLNTETLSKETSRD